MPKVKLPRAEWVDVLMIIEEYANRDWPRDPNPFIMAVHKEISDQVYSQEY